MRQLSRDSEYRRETGLFVCDGEKQLGEALAWGARLGEILLREGRPVPELPDSVTVNTACGDVFDYASPLSSSPGPLFSVFCEEQPLPSAPRSVIVLENLQDPGNVGTVLRTAAALGMDLVILAGECADPYNPKAVRAAMGAVFRQKVARMDLADLAARLKEWKLPLYGAALADDARDVRSVSLAKAAVAVGNEGNGLSRELLELCDAKIIIPMTPGSESLNAAVAASVLMWETARLRE